MKDIISNLFLIVIAMIIIFCVSMAVADLNRAPFEALIEALGGAQITEAK